MTAPGNERLEGAEGLVLKPCPFCGGEARRVTLGQNDGPDNEGGDVIVCTGVCGASSHVEFGFKENLVSLWNARTEADGGVREALERTREALTTARDYVADAAKGALTYEDSGEGFIAMAAGDLLTIDAALTPEAERVKISADPALAHIGDPCRQCGTPHDEVASGPCPNALWHCNACWTNFKNDGSVRPKCPCCKADDQYTYPGPFVRYKPTPATPAEQTDQRAGEVERIAYHVVLKAMREAMESHPFWRKVVGTPAENDLPVRAANVAAQFI